MSKKILIVDDSLFVRESLKMLFIKNGYEIAGEAANGEEGIKKANLLKPDLITMDITMPGTISGLEAIKQILTDNPDNRIVVCSAMGDKYNLKEAILAGAKDFVVKPYQPERLLEAIKKYIA